MTRGPNTAVAAVELTSSKSATRNPHFSARPLISSAVILKLKRLETRLPHADLPES
jgi:hypothetical protein